MSGPWKIRACRDASSSPAGVAESAEEGSRLAHSRRSMRTFKLALFVLLPPLSLLVGCATGGDVTFELHHLAQPAMLSTVDRIEEPRVPHTHKGLVPTPQSCTYAKNILVLPLPGFMVGVSSEKLPEPAKPALALQRFGDEVNFQIERIDLRHTALWAAFFFREVNEVEIDCAVERLIEEREGDEAG